MKLYKHYKNQYYKYLGIVKHSETLEELVLYETRYESAEGRSWVRPKKMFFEEIEVRGEKTPRFRKIPLEIRTSNAVTAKEVEIIAPIMQTVFGELDTDKFHARLKQFAKFHLLMGYVEDQPVGFKLGYERDSTLFYSWLGGILPEFRGLGIAGDLMNAQHQWCKEQGYLKVQTKTENRYKEMLLLNVQHGFQVTGTEVSDRGCLKVLFEKTLLK